MLFVLIPTNRSSWSPHTLPIKDCHVLESFTPAFYRVATSSLDRSVVIYDIHQATVVLYQQLIHSGNFFQPSSPMMMMMMENQALISELIDR